MHKIKNDSVRDWFKHGHHWCPKSIDTWCGYCGRLTNFPIEGDRIEVASKTLVASRPCPGCRNMSRFYILDPGSAEDLSQKGCAFIAVHPAPSTPRKGIESKEHIPWPIYKAYMDVVKVYNTGVWSATATCGRRTLEGIIEHLLPNENRIVLAAGLEKLAKEIDLKKPLLDLATSIRRAGNLGAHFDSEISVDEPIAKAMLDLVEYLLEYLFVLPRQIEALESRLTPLNITTEDNATSISK